MLEITTRSAALGLSLALTAATTAGGQKCPDEDLRRELEALAQGQQRIQRELVESSSCSSRRRAVKAHFGSGV